MNINQLRKELERDEGCKYEIYLDHLGYPTFGIGHLITDDDPESRVWPHGLGKTSVGVEVSEERVKEALILISKQFCQTAAVYMNTLMICLKKSN